MDVALSSLLALLSTLVAIPLVRNIALKYGMVDVPGGRKQHEEPVPPVGGIVIFSVLILVTVLFQSFTKISFPPALYLSLGIILVVGVVDDMHTIPARLKFLVHFLVAGILVIWGGAKITFLGNLLGFGTIYLDWMAVPFSIACIVYIINAVNMMDGLDGLAGGNAVIVFSWFGLAAYVAGNTAALGEIAVLLSCILGFLFFNARSPWLKHAKVFLGDAGSMGIGVMIAWYAITLSQSPDNAIHPISVAWILALPIVDAFGLLVARMKDGKPPFSPDRRHFHHHFINAGFGVGATVSMILIWSLILGLIGFAGVYYGAPAFVLGWLWIALWMGHTFLTIRSGKFITLLSGLRNRSGT